MTGRNERDYLILKLLFAKEEMSFTDLQDAGIMAKSTLNDHLHSLLEKKEVRKAIGKTPKHHSHPVYLITAKGRRTYTGMRRLRATHIKYWGESPSRAKAKRRQADDPLTYFEALFRKQDRG